MVSDHRSVIDAHKIENVLFITLLFLHMHNISSDMHACVDVTITKMNRTIQNNGILC